MTSVEDSTDNIGGLEKINTLWKTYNNLINTKPASFAVNEEIPFRNFVVSSEILNQTIPDNIPVIQNTIINVELPTNNIIQFTITPSDTSFVTISFLDYLFDSCNNILPGSICNFENFGYKHIEFFYKKECYPTIYGTSTQIYTWFIPDPSNGNITNSNTRNLLKNTIPYLFDPYNNTYKFKIFYRASNGSFVIIPLASNPDFAYIDNKSGFLYFYGGTRTGNNVILDNIRSQNDSNPSPPYISYIRYNGNIGFDNLNLTGNTIIDGSLSIINDNSFSDISNLAYNILNTQQIKQYVENLNISGGSNNNSLTLNDILNSNNDASFNNLDISGFLKINEKEVATKNYIDNSFTLNSSFNELSSNFGILENSFVNLDLSNIYTTNILFNDLSSNFSILDSQVQTICGANFALKINEISGDVLLIESDIISISGRIDNIKTIVNNLDVSYLTDIAFELSYNDLSNIYVNNSLFNELSSNFSILENSFVSLDLSNTLNKIDTSLINLQNNIDVINNNNSNSNISNKYIFSNIELLNENSIVNIVNSNGNKYVFNNDNTYDASKNYGLKNGNYILNNIPEAHPIALLNNDISNLISYNVVDNNPIIIKVSGGQSSSPYYNFNDSNDNSININDFKFMRNRSYQFTANGISSSHPFKIYVNNSFTNVISGSSGNINFTINSNHSLVDGDFYYICNNHSGMKNNISILNNNINGINYDFYYGDISINVSGDFDKTSVYCYYHGYMGGENLLMYVLNFYTTTNSALQDLSALFFNTITPSKNNSNILININITLFCSYALEERINVELWRDLSMLTQSKDIGSVIATGGSNIPYNLTYLDENINNTQKKYYLKYQMENNNSQQNMGLVNLQTSQNNGLSNFLLREI